MSKKSKRPQFEDESDSDDFDSDSSDIAPSFDMYSLPVQRRIGAVKKLHLDFKSMQEEFMKERAELNKKFEAIFQAVFKKQNEIVSGEYEPKDEDLVEPSTLGWEQTQITATSETPVSGVPSFWKTSLLNSKSLKSIIHSRDIPLIDHITAVRRTEESVDKETYDSLQATVGLEELPPIEKVFKITLEMTFSPNNYFENTTLQKVIVVSYSPDGDIMIHNTASDHDEDENEEEEEEDEEFEKKKSKKHKKEKKEEFSLPIEPTIKWKAGKRIGDETVTVKTTAKTGKGKNKKTTKISKPISLHLPSFFDLFLTPPELQERWKQFQETLEEMEKPEVEEAVKASYGKEGGVDGAKEFKKDEHRLTESVAELDDHYLNGAVFIAETLIPHAYNFFMNEADKFEDDDEEDDEDEFDMDEDEEDDDDDDDEDDDDEDDE